MNAIQAAARKNRLQDENRGSPTKQNGSPVKGILGNHQNHPKEPILQKRAKDKDVRIPTKIEEIPFRRQDRRVLNARKKRVLDRQLIKAVVLFGVLMVLAGAAMIVVWILYQEKEPKVRIFLVAGPVIAGCGILFCCFSFEVCVRLRKNAKRVKDPEIDKLTNLHQIKHWVEPELIMFAWGHPEDGSDTSDYVNDYGGAVLQDVDEDPAAAMALEMAKRRESTDSEIPKDIFDESTRYSGIDRPSFVIERSSPTAKRKGSFVDASEKIANLFSPKKK